MGLLRNVRFDDLVRDVATAAAEVAPSPHMASPKALAQMGKLREQTIGAFTFHPLDQPTDGDVWRDRDQDMPMIWGDMPLEDIDTRLLTFFPDDRTHSFRHFTTQYLVAVLGDPDDMQVNREGRVRAMAVVTHARESSENLLKLPPQGGGFAPPNWRQ